jgi:hypothetical protein
VKLAEDLNALRVPLIRSYGSARTGVVWARHPAGLYHGQFI